MLLVMTETNLNKREQFLDCSHSRFGGKVLHFLNRPFFLNKVDDFTLRSLYPRAKNTLLTGQEGKWALLVPILSQINRINTFEPSSYIATHKLLTTVSHE